MSPLSFPPLALGYLRLHVVRQLTAFNTAPGAPRPASSLKAPSFFEPTLGLAVGLRPRRHGHAGDHRTGGGGDLPPGCLHRIVVVHDASFARIPAEVVSVGTLPPWRWRFLRRCCRRHPFFSSSWPIMAHHRLGPAVKLSGPGQLPTSGVRPLDGLGQAQQLGQGAIRRPAPLGRFQWRQAASTAKAGARCPEWGLLAAGMGLTRWTGVCESSEGSQEDELTRDNGPLESARQVP